MILGQLLIVIRNKIHSLNNNGEKYSMQDSMQNFIRKIYNNKSLFQVLKIKKQKALSIPTPEIKKCNMFRINDKNKFDFEEKPLTKQTKKQGKGKKEKNRPRAF